MNKNKDNTVESPELSVLSKISDYETRRYLISQINLKKQLSDALESSAINEFERMKYAEALKVIEDNIQKFRMEGLL